MKNWRERCNIKIMRKIVLYFCCAMLSVEVIVLSIKNQQLMRTIENIENSITDQNISGDVNLYSGLVEISEWNTGVKANALEFRNNSRAAIVFYFSATCSPCDEAATYWNIIYAKYCEEFNIFGLSRDNKDAIRKYIVRNNVQFPIYIINKLDKSLESIMSRTPTTLILSKDGTINRVYEGIISELDSKLAPNNKAWD